MGRCTGRLSQCTGIPDDNRIIPRFPRRACSRGSHCRRDGPKKERRRVAHSHIWILLNHRVALRGAGASQRGKSENGSDDDGDRYLFPRQPGERRKEQRNLSTQVALNPLVIGTCSLGYRGGSSHTGWTDQVLDWRILRKVPQSVLARHYAGLLPKRLKDIYDQGGLRIFPCLEIGRSEQLCPNAF